MCAMKSSSLETWVGKLGSELISSQCKGKNIISDMIHCVYNLKTNQLFRTSAASPENETQTLIAMIMVDYI